MACESLGRLRSRRRRRSGRARVIASSTATRSRSGSPTARARPCASSASTRRRAGGRRRRSSAAPSRPATALRRLVCTARRHARARPDPGRARSLRPDAGLRGRRTTDAGEAMVGVGLGEAVRVRRRAVLAVGRLSRGRAARRDGARPGCTGRAAGTFTVPGEPANGEHSGGERSRARGSTHARESRARSARTSIEPHFASMRRRSSAPRRAPSGQPRTLVSTSNTATASLASRATRAPPRRHRPQRPQPPAEPEALRQRAPQRPPPVARRRHRDQPRSGPRPARAGTRPPRASATPAGARAGQSRARGHRPADAAQRVLDLRDRAVHRGLAARAADEEQRARDQRRRAGRHGRTRAASANRCRRRRRRLRAVGADLQVRADGGRVPSRRSGGVGAAPLSGDERRARPAARRRGDAGAGGVADGVGSSVTQPYWSNQTSTQACASVSRTIQALWRSE